MDWFSAHFAALLSVTPRHGRAFFAHCDVPACHEYAHMDVGDDEGVEVAIVVVNILLMTTAINNFIAVFLLLLKNKNNN